MAIDASFIMNFPLKSSKITSEIKGSVFGVKLKVTAFLQSGNYVVPKSMFKGCGSIPT